jgi:hypothetical protein
MEAFLLRRVEPPTASFKVTMSSDLQSSTHPIAP